MQTKFHTTSFDDILDAKYGAVGTAERESFRKEASDYCASNSADASQKEAHSH